MKKGKRRALGVLIVSEDAPSAERIGTLLAGGRLYDATWERVGGCDAARSRLERPGVDAVLVRMGTACQAFLQELHGGQPASLGAPVVVLCDHLDNGLSEELLAAGAQECLPLAEIDAGDLERALRHALERHRLITELRELALIDELTGLYNRRAFFTLGEQMLRMAERSGDGVAVFFFDLDNLKYVNDVGGHAAGDRQLSDLAGIFRDTFRTSDLISRLGGDEFAILAVASGSEDAEALIERFRAAVERYNADSSNEHGISVSAGAALFDPKAPHTLEQLLAEADRAMYREKWTKKAAREAHAAKGA